MVASTTVNTDPETLRYKVILESSYPDASGSIRQIRTRTFGFRRGDDGASTRLSSNKVAFIEVASGTLHNRHSADQPSSGVVSFSSASRSGCSSYVMVSGATSVCGR